MQPLSFPHRAQLSVASHLDFPRIHFAGRYHADVNTVNNYIENFDPFHPKQNLTPGWNPSGGNGWSLTDCYVTSVVYENGSSTNNTEHEPTIGASVVTNPDSVSGKLVSLDAKCQNKCALYGVTIGIKLLQHFAFVAEWIPGSVLCQNIWQQVICNSISNPQYYGARSVSKLTNISWRDNINNSEIISQLKRASSRSGYLTVSVSLYSFSRTPTKQNSSYGYIVGTIGVTRPDDAAFFEGERLMSFEFVEQPKLKWPEGHSCADTKYKNAPFWWMYRAPFKVHPQIKMLTVDFSSAIAIDWHSATELLDIGKLYVGILYTEYSGGCVDIIGSVGYRETRWRERTGGVVDYHLSDAQLQGLLDNPLVVVRLRESVPWTWGTYPMCATRMFHSLKSTHDVIVMIQEQPYYVRPFRNYADFRLEAGQYVTVPVYVTRFGKPATGEIVEVVPANPWAAPVNGVEYTAEARVDYRGLATLVFIAGEIGTPRRNMGLDGQVYRYMYHVRGDHQLEFCPTPLKNAPGLEEFLISSTCIDEISIKVYSNPILEDKGPYTWVDHVQPIFNVYHRLYPVMQGIMDMSSYADITKPQNLKLLNLSMQLDMFHPNYMPVSRDLPPAKQRMILQWIQKPCYNKTHCRLGLNKKYLDPEVKERQNILDKTCDRVGDFRIPPYDPDQYFSKTAIVIAVAGAQAHIDNCITQLNAGRCTVGDLQDCLQDAVQLEFATIPPYLTALYSIKDGYNQEAYSLIRSIVMQEMLHMVQAANLLIAVGGRPRVYGAKITPKYPTTGLPGGTLPQLQVSLKRASLEHIHHVFMAIEYPHVVVNKGHGKSELHTLTIGKLYSEVKQCLETLGDGVFYANRTVLQIRWPWDTNDYGTVFVVKDLASALQAIEEIVEQGEGTQPGDPRSYELCDLAHYFRFQEIVCQRKLVFHGVSNYSFTGEPIPFDPEGVWPMRDDPSSRGLTPGTKAYYATKVFHSTYHTLLQKLEEVFGGDPDGTVEAMTIMESLEVQAKRLMQLPLHKDSEYTCGPVFEFEWHG